MLAIVCWAAKPTIRPTTAVEARTPAARRCRLVNWLSASIARTKRIATMTRRRRIRSRVLVLRETCETAGDMEANLAGEGVAQRPASFPYSNWGPAAALLGVIAALGAGIV